MTQPIQLILVDLDNLRNRPATHLPAPKVGPDTSPLWLESTGDPPEPDSSRPPCVVAFAMNLDTASNPMHEYAELDAFAERLARVLGRATLLGVEVALTLPVKESADKALERLLEAAPMEAHAGELSAVHILTDDWGLSREVARFLGTATYRPRKYTTERVRSWFAVAAADKRLRQTQRHRPTLVIDAEAPGSPVAVIDTPALAAWASTVPVQLRSEGSLLQLVEAVEGRPGLLTQVGITKKSVRGIARHCALARGETPLLEPCAAEDGLELCPEDVAPGRYQRASESSLGAGAVRLWEPRFATVTTLLPPVAINAVEGDFLVASNRQLHARETLAHVTTAGLAAQPFDVLVRVNSEGIVAEIISDFGASLPAWWLRGQKTFSKHRVKNAGGGRSRVFTVKGIADLVDEDGRRVLSVRAPFTDEVQVELSQPIGPGGLELGLVQGVAVAVLAHDGSQYPAGTLACRAVQELAPTALRDAYPSLQRNVDDLKRFPLMVPL